MYNIPILFIIFNRMQTTEQVFKCIRSMQPKTLYIAADGPRENNNEDSEKCAKVRKWVIDSIDWPCDVSTLFRDKNLGCKYAVSGAIKWFFEHVDMGIVLEDDIVADQTFFFFSEEMLLKYQHDTNVSSISGTNLIGTSYTMDNSYTFSKYGGIWGWASWKRAIRDFDVEMAMWQNRNTQKKIKKTMSWNQFDFMKNIFNSANSINTWDYQWWFHKLSHGMVDIIPAVNLCKNIGFNQDATHTFNIESRIMDLAINPISFPLKHSRTITVDKRFDRKISREYYSIKNEPFRILRKIRSRLGKLLGISRI